MSRALLYEVNTRCWLADWSRRLGRAVGLDQVPTDDLERWRKLGFTHVWLMGVWAVGTRSRQVALELPETRRGFDEVLPGWAPEDVLGSPYAIEAYRVPAAMGGQPGLRRIRECLHAAGLELLLDFVPNHVGLDHPWLRTRPDWFIAGSPASGGAFRQTTTRGERWLAHGKDPGFPPWIDTAQLDYTRSEVRAAVISELRSVIDQCDGVRCDMAMLLLNEVFARTWNRPLQPGVPPPAEFWAEAINAVRRPGCTFLAEAYWDLEERLQELGFDWTYDKKVTDFLMGRDGAGLQRHLLAKRPEFVRRSVHFLENHDEPRVVGRLSLAEHRAAALLILGLPGPALFHEGQLEGAHVRASVHLRRRLTEPVDEGIVTLYAELLAAWRESAVGSGPGPGRVLQPERVSGEDDLAEKVILVLWPGAAGGFDLVVANITATAGSCRVMLPEEMRPGMQWETRDRLGTRSGGGVRAEGESGIWLQVPAHAAWLLQFTPAGQIQDRSLRFTPLTRAG